MKAAKNDKIELVIDNLTSEGSGVGRYDGMAVFVRGAVPGDRIIAHIIKVSKKYAVAIIDKILSPSSQRIESDCPYSQKCGGCSFRNMTYQEELKYKKSRVQDAVERIGHLDVTVDEIIGADNVNRYRNKAQYPVSICDGELFAGFYAYKSHRIIPCADCRLQSEDFEKGISAFSKWAEQTNITSYDENTDKGLLRHIYFRKGFGTGEIMACAVINGNDIPQRDLLISLLRENLPNLKSVVLNINKEKTNVILGRKSKTIWGSDTIEDILLGKRFVISPNSFYQVNHDQCEKLYSKAKELADLKGDEVLLDLYCGVGTIGITMADSVKQLVGIEIIPQAVENAKKNAEINGIENAQFICADAPKGAEILKEQGIKPDVIVLDPPRKGCDRSLFDTIEILSPKKLVYVSCDSATLARDLEILNSKHYKTQKIVAVDMFPRTPHVETVVMLSHKKPDSAINVKVEFGEGLRNTIYQIVKRKMGDADMIKIDAGDFCLIEPSEIYAEQIREYRQDFLDTNCSMDGCGPLRKCEDPITYISECEKCTVSETLPDGLVIATQFFYVRKADNRLVGMIQVRHYFNDYLSKYGGHIGYSIRPNERRKGYATSMLNAVLPYCREIGLDKILIACIDGNIGSEKTILNNGGTYESTVYESGQNRSLKRFWITL